MTTTWAEVHSGVETPYCATLQIAQACSVSGEEHHFVPEMRPEQLGKVAQVVVVTGEIAAIFILHLRKDIRGGGIISTDSQQQDFIDIHLEQTRPSPALL